jgi:hypothetical protein
LKFSQPASLIFSPPAAINGSSTAGNIFVADLSAYNRIHILERSGAASTLYFLGKGLQGSGQNFRELPPVPPEGCFDARFANGSDIAELGLGQTTNAGEPLAIQAVSYPLTIAWNVHPSSGISYVLKENSSSGKIIAELSDSGSILLRDMPSAGLSLTAGNGANAVETPREFALYQNMPNPFNPATTIRFDLPSRSRVRVEVYNLLGQSVATLVDDLLEAGVHSVVWAPSGSSGIYFYRIEATEADGGDRHFGQVRKMVYIK